MCKWLKLENGIKKLVIKLQYRNGEEKELVYNTCEGNQKYLEFMEDRNIHYGQLTEIYKDKKIDRASFCNG